MDPSSLLTDDAFARRLAIGLLRDRDAAEDLVQETWREVLEHPPRHAGNPRGYFARILRRLRARKHRGDARREGRERDRGAGEPAPHTGELVARAEIHQRTVAAVLALDEPYRSTVLLRFFEDLTPEEIAERERVPAETVRTRLKRALGMLRARLEREGRAWRDEWALALGGGTWPGKELARGSTPALRQWKMMVGVAATIAAVWLVRARAAAPDSAPEERVAAADGGARPEIESGVLAPAPAAERAPLVVDNAPPIDAPPPVLAGKVVDASGQPVAGAHVELGIQRFYGSPVLAHERTGDDGRFKGSLAEWSALGVPVRDLYELTVTAWKPGYRVYSAPVELGQDRMPRSADIVVELSPGRVFHGRVVDASGAPVRTVNVQAAIRPSDPTWKERVAATINDRDGLFVFGLEEGERLVDLLVRHPDVGFAFLAETDLPAGDAGDVDVGDVALDAAQVLRGRCVDPEGQPVVALLISAILAEPAPGGGYRKAGKRPRAELPSGLTSVVSETDADGRFAFHGLRAGAFHVYAGPMATATVLDERVFASGGTELELVHAQHRLSVEVVGPDEHAVAEARVALTPVSSTGEPVATAERCLTGAGENPRALVDVEPGQRFAVVAVVPGWTSAEELVEIPASPYLTRVRLKLGVEVRRATIELRPSSGAATDWEVDLCSPLSGTPLPGFQDLVTNADGRVVGVPMGAYRVRVQPRARDGDEPPPLCATDVSTPVELGEGVTPLAFAVEPAARLRVAFSGTPKSAKRELPEHQDAGSHGVGAGTIDVDALEGAGTGRWDWLVGSLIPSKGSLELHALRPDGEQMLRRLAGLQPAPGRTLDLVVPAVSLRLRVALVGRAPFDRELAPAPGETLEIPVPLDESSPVR